ncbi:helix-turn-helix transcriptional regulator [Brucella tritici]|jgi:transcriptional regulator with XRE-family HTH domain|uniref:Helix-turn-helix transcriptional regulator n=1 Tax=Brucella tritici TaxID=94626 RepID=A0A833CHL8_9HYPH|nr:MULTISPECIES: helix-turn-helix transcriptional regulator [Brucella/Ochrobactrum group]KAB2662047.1 helix-turn-helix transcriptional regulator [Brucella tritici]MDH0369935.1 helix-turn-helix domain-containing protein [Brucella anthropi]QPA26427.1 helix-turn-helix transcriptional regulator [Brucella anthropi]RRY07784.1 XRE family transcriptional regulator [Brucella anthropi]RRY15894.1 XRE family transcriptional regulator [Brucella anthropi]
MNARTRIAWNLRQIRSNQGITQENLAVDANVDRTAISGIETGDYNPTIDLLERLAEALSIDIVDLVSKVPDGAQAPRPMRAGRKPKRS